MRYNTEGINSWSNLINNISTKFTIPDLLRYSVAYLCLFVLIIPAGWVLLELVSFVSLTWLNMGGSLRLHKVGYYLLSFVNAVLWVSAAIFAEDWFRTSIYAIRIKRARITSAASSSTENPSENGILGRLQKLGLDLLYRRVRIAAFLVIALLVWNFIIQQIFSFII